MYTVKGGLEIGSEILESFDENKAIQAFNIKPCEVVLTRVKIPNKQAKEIYDMEDTSEMEKNFNLNLILSPTNENDEEVEEGPVEGVEEGDLFNILEEIEIFKHSIFAVGEVRRRRGQRNNQHRLRQNIPRKILVKRRYAAT